MRRKILVSMVVILSLILAGQMFWGYWAAPRLAIRKIVLESDLGLSNSQVLSMLQLKGETWASLDEGELVERLEQYPVVRKAIVKKIFPDSLGVHIFRRNPLAVALIDSDTGSMPVVFDDEGFVIQVGRGEEPLDLPVMSGPRFPIPALGARLPESFREIFSSLSELRRENPTLFDVVSELEILLRGNESFEVRMYMNQVRTPVLMDRYISVESVRRAMIALDIIRMAGESGVGEVDIRGGRFVYYYAEES